MRAMVLLPGAKQLELKDIPVPSPQPDEVLVKVFACGVCRTDLHILDRELKTPMQQLVPGHQIVGRVVDFGSQARRFAIGDHVGIPWLGGTCGSCFYCQKHLENLCDYAVFTGFQRDGGYAEYCTAREEYCFPLPPDYTDVEAAPFLCGGLIGYRALKLCGDAQRVGLLGFGASAHLITQVAVQMGREVFAFTRRGDTKRQEFAKSLGACWSGSIEVPPDELLDAMIIFATDGSLVPASLPLLRKGGSVVCAGIHMSDITSFHYVDLWNERVIRSVANLTRDDAVEFLEHAAKHHLKTETTLYPLEKANEALDDLRQGRFFGSAVLTL